MMPMGRLGDIIGRRKVFLIGIVIFALGMAFTALSPIFGVLIAARVLSAIGNSMTQSVGNAMGISLFPDNQRAKAIGMSGTMVALGMASGPVISGVMLQFFNWQAIFWLMTAPLLLSFVLGFFLLKESVVSRNLPTKRPPFDWVGSIVSASVVVIGVLIINNPFAQSVLSPVMLGGIMSAVILLGFFIWWELRSDSPMLQLRLFNNRQFSLAVTTRYIGFLGQTATFLLMPIYLVGIREFETAAAGGMLLMTSIGMGSASQISGRLSGRFGERNFQIFGFGLLAIVALTYTTFTVDTPVWVAMLMMVLTGFSLGSWVVSNGSVLMGTVPKSSIGVVGALSNLSRNVGSVTGQAIATTIVVGVMASRSFDIPLDDIAGNDGAISAFMAGWRYAFLAVAIMSIVSLVIATFAGSIAKDEEVAEAKAG
jgi:MFS family permease